MALFCSKRLSFSNKISSFWSFMLYENCTHVKPRFPSFPRICRYSGWTPKLLLYASWLRVHCILSERFFWESLCYLHPCIFVLLHYRANNWRGRSDQLSPSCLLRGCDPFQKGIIAFFVFGGSSFFLALCSGQDFSRFYVSVHVHVWSRWENPP